MNSNSKNARPHRADHCHMKWGSGSKMPARPSERDAAPGQVFQVTLENPSLFTLVCNRHLHGFTKASLSWHTDRSLQRQPQFPPASQQASWRHAHLTATPWFSVAVICKKTGRRSIRTYGWTELPLCFSAKTPTQYTHKQEYCTPKRSCSCYTLSDVITVKSLPHICC